nr:hypothetical protein [Pleurocapsa sp. MO_226.B13]
FIWEHRKLIQMLKFINLKNLTAFTFMAFLTAGLIVQPATANDDSSNNNNETTPEVGGDNARILDWSEVLAADPDGWVTDSGSNGTRDDLYRVYYHQPSGKYVKVTVDQRWGWGGARKSDNDPYPYSPKIVDYSRWGTGGFDGEDMFLFSLKTKRNQVNRLTVQFFNDSQLTDKADVSNLNFTLTDLDGAGGGKARENIIVSAENSFGSTVPIEFYQPEGSVIEDSWINGGSVLGKPTGVRGPEGNIAPVLLGDTHKVEIVYQLAPNSNEKNQVRHMYVSDLAWGGEAVNVTPDEEVNIEEITNPDSGDYETTSSTEDSDGNGILDVDELNPDEDPDNDGIVNVEDPDDDGDGIDDVDEMEQDPSDPNKKIPTDPDNDDKPSHQDEDSDNNGILDQDEHYGSPTKPDAAPNSTNPLDYDHDDDGIPDYQDFDDDGDNIADVMELYPLGVITSATSVASNNIPNPPEAGIGGDSQYSLPRNSDDDDIYDYHDTDSDDDGILDRIEKGNSNLTSFPVNSEPDATSDSQLATYLDTDTTPDYLDDDSDGDGIFDSIEAGTNLENPPATPFDSDSDGNYDFQEIDSDGDRIPDFIEVEYENNELFLVDSDGDGKYDYQDKDSDDDTIPDSVEAIDDDPQTPVPTYVYEPVNTDVESDDVSGEGDLDPDYLDLDSDDDLLEDEDEAGDDPTNPVDEDEDGTPEYRQPEAFAD